MKKLILALLFLTACGEKESTVYTDMQPPMNCSAYYQEQVDKWGNTWFLFQTSKGSCTGQVGKTFAECGWN